MSKAIEQKQTIVEDIVQMLSNSKSTIVTDYRGLNVKQVNELRKKLREAGVEYRVLKNTLTRRATERVGLTDIDKHLEGPTAIAFSNEDVVAPAKVLFKFSKENDALEIKGGVVEGKIVGYEEIKSLADLPSREDLLSMLLSVLQAPIRNFALAIKAVSEKDGSSQELSEEDKD